MAFLFGVRDARIKLWSSTGTYTGNLIDLIGVQSVEFTITSTNATLTGDDAELDKHSFSTGCRARVRFAKGTDTLDALALLLGATVESSGGNEKLVISNDQRPYVGFMAQVYETDGAGDNHLYIPKAKLTQDFGYTPQYGQYMMQELTLDGVIDGVEGAHQIIENAATTPIAIPPAF